MSVPPKQPAAVPAEHQGNIVPSTAMHTAETQRTTSTASARGASANIETEMVHSGEEPNFREGGSGDVVMPIHLATTFARREIEKPTAGYEYARTANPTRDAVETRLRTLEGARFGLACSSGVAAESLVVLALLKSGDHVVAFDDLYGGSRRVFTEVFQRRFGVVFDFVDARDTQAVAAAIRPHTRLIWLESPTNPLLKLCDIVQISAMAHAQECIVVVDNTFMSPYFQRPLSLGADIVVHSTTKYLGGHSDSVGGAVMLNDPAMYQQLQFTQNSVGMIMSPFDSYLLLRGTKTLGVRMQRIAHNAQRVAEYLHAHPKVETVTYPGLDDYPQRALAKKQMSGMGGMITFLITGGMPEARRFLGSVELCALAESLGAVETLIEHPALMTHASVPEEARRAIGIYNGLIRISIGIEHSDDIIADLERGFRAV